MLSAMSPPINQTTRPHRNRKAKRAVPFAAIWWLALAGVLSPLLWMAYQALSGGVVSGLGANPIEAINRFLGDWALRFLLITLAMTPLKNLTGKPWPLRLRRMMGLAAFAYAVLHVSSYVMLDQFFDWNAIWGDIIKRRYITVGMIVITLLLPLAITSTAGAAKRLGSKRWKKLHKLVYPAAALGCLHFFWMVKADILEPTIYALVFVVLMVLRWKKAAPAFKRKN